MRGRRSTRSWSRLRPVPPAIDDPDLTIVESVSTTEDCVAADPERKTEREWAGEDLESKAEMDARPYIGRCILRIHDKLTVLSLLVEIGKVSHVQPHSGLAVDPN